MLPQEKSPGSQPGPSDVTVVEVRPVVPDSSSADPPAETPQPADPPAAVDGNQTVNELASPDSEAAGTCVPGTSTATSGHVGDALDSASPDLATLKVWDVATGAELFEMSDPPRPAGFDTSVAFFSSGNEVASVSRDGRYRLWDLTERAPWAGFKVHQGQRTTVAVYLGGRWMVTGGTDGKLATIRCLCSRSGGRRRRLRSGCL